MPTVLGLTSLQFKPQADFSARQSENGGWTASQSFVFLGQALDNYAFRAHFANGTPATTLDTSLPSFWSFLALISVDVNHEEGSLATIVVNYSGTPIVEGGGDNSEQTEIVTYSLSGTMSQRSIVDHPSVVALAEAERKKLGLLLNGDIYYDATDGAEEYRQETTSKPYGDTITFSSGDAATFAAKIVKAETTYDAPSFLWTEQKERSDGLTAAELNLVGKVDSNVPGSPPAVAGNRDWRLISATQDFDGNLYRITRQWELSEPGGWDSDTYDY